MNVSRIQRATGYETEFLYYPTGWEQTREATYQQRLEDMKNSEIQVGKSYIFRNDAHFPSITGKRVVIVSDSSKDLDHSHPFSGIIEGGIKPFSIFRHEIFPIK